MDNTDKRISEHELSVAIGKSISLWMKKNGIDCPVAVSCAVSYPTCYVDESGIPHSGPVILCNVDIADDDFIFDDDDDDD